MKRHILFFLISLFLFPIIAQEYHQGDSYSFNADKQGWHIYEAKNSIRLSDGFSYSASSAESFTAKVNNKMLFPNMTNAYLKSDGKTTSSPDSGYAVGAIPGQFNVSPTGAATYTIPIEVPPGVNGMQPNIALSYNSQAGNGIAGWGWNISGMSAITRVPKTIYHDGEVKGIQWDDSDVLVLDGNRLFEVNRTNYPSSIEYRTEVDNGSRIVGYDITDAGPASFKVFTKDGKTIFYEGASQIYSKSGGIYIQEYSLDVDTINNWFITEWHSEDPIGSVENFHVRGYGHWRITKVTDNYNNYCEYNYLDSLSSQSGGCVSGKSPEILNPTDPRNANNVLYSYSINIRKELYHHNYDTVIVIDGDYIDPFDSPSLYEAIEDGKDYINNLIQDDGMSKGRGYGLLVYKNESTCSSSPRIDERLVSITYGHANDHIAKLQFHYEDREQPISGYLAGYKQEQNKRLDSINVVSTYGDDTKLKTYQLNYQKGKDKLASVGLEGMNDDKLKETCFSWEASKLDNCTSTILLSNADGPVGFAVADRMDKFKYKNARLFNGVFTYETRSGQIIIEEKEDSLVDILLEDIDNDKIADLVKVYCIKKDKDKYKLIYKFERSSNLQIFELETEYFKNGVGLDHIWADFTGDGNLEIIIKSKKTLYDNFGNEITTLDEDISDYIKFRHFSDFTGDGKNDLAVVNNTSLKIYSLIGNSFVNELSTNYHNLSRAAAGVVGDYNGDGIADILSISLNAEDYILYSTGKGFVKGDDLNINYKKGDEARSSYIDSDNKSEIVVFNYGLHKDKYFPRVTTYHNEGAGIFREYCTELNENIYGPYGNVQKPVFLGLRDMTGDGVDEVVHISNNNYNCPGYSLYSETAFDGWLYDRASITSIYNGIQTIKLKYEGKQPKVYGNRNIISLKTTQLEHISYTFEDSEFYNRGYSYFQGFRKITIENEIDKKTRVVEKKMDSNFHFLKPWRTTSKVGKSIVNQKNCSVSVNSIDPFNDKRYRVETNSITEINTINKMRIKKLFKYENGNLIKDSLYYFNGSIPIDSISKTINLTYPNNNNWLDNFPTKVISTSKKGDETIIRTIDKEYYSTGKLKKQISDLNTPYENNTVYTYDEYGNTESIKQSAPNDEDRTEEQSTVLEYTDDGRFVKNKTTQGLTTSYQYNLALGQLIAQTAPSGLTTRYFYNSMGRCYKTQNPIGVESVSTLNWVPAKVDGVINSAADDAPDDALYYTYSKTSGIAPSKTYYNKIGQVRRTVTQGYANDQIIYIDREYYADGRMKQESLPYFSTTNEAGVQWNKYYYEADYNRLSKIEYADSTEQVKGYNDALREDTTIIRKTEEGQTVTQKSISKRNALGQTIASIDDIGNTVTYDYDAVGRLKNSYVDDNYITEFKYDLLGNRISIKDPDAGYVSSEYNAFGQLMSQTNARMQTTAYKYDELGRVITEKTTEIIDGDSTLLNKLEYDFITSGVAVGQLDFIKQKNKLVERFSYDNLGRMNGKTEYVDGQSFVHSYTYDDYSRIATQTYPSGYTINNKYTNNGDLELIKHVVNGSSSTIYENKDFTALGALTKYNLGSMSAIKHYDDIGRLDYQGCGDIQSTNYAYDEMSNLDHRIDDIHHQSEYFSYDNLNRLTNAYSDANRTLATQSQIYDATGNILSKTGVGANIKYAENGKPHALTSINTPIGYQPPNQNIEYTYFNKVKSIDQNNGDYTYDYTYGIDHQRRKTVYKEGSTVKRTKYYLGNYEKVIEDGVTKEYHYLSADCGMFGIFVKTNGNSGELKYILTDHLGSLIEVLDASGSHEQSFSYDAWGNPRSSNDWAQNAVNQLLADRGFTGHEHLPAAFGLIDMNGRMYDPVLGRFLSPDPYVQAPDYSQSFNRYSYCLNNPLLYTDPSGYKWSDPFKQAWDWSWDKLEQFAQWADNKSWFPSSGGAGYNTSKGFCLKVGDNPWVYPGEVSAINNGEAAAGVKFDDFVSTYGDDYRASSGGGSVGQPGTWESMIPIWGSGRAAIDHFENGNYWRGAGYTALAISDVFLVKSLATAAGKGAWKLGAHSWSATRSWLGKNGYAKAGQPVHHWAVSQSTAKKYGLEAITNQPWNLKTFANQSIHMRAGHGYNYLGQPGFGTAGQLWYGTPIWPKAVIGSYGGRGAMGIGD